MRPPFIRLRKMLAAELESPAWPFGVRPIGFEPAIHAEPVHRLLVDAYAQGGGAVAPFAVWRRRLLDDDEYDPSLLFLAALPTGRVIGVAQCWTSAYIKDLAVADGWRRRGVGAALLRHSFNAFRARGAACVDLKVEVDNPSHAERLYHQMGMVAVEGD